MADRNDRVVIRRLMDGESVFINITAGEWLDTATRARKEARRVSVAGA